MKKEKYVVATLIKADAMLYEVEEGSFFASSAVKKWGWILEFDNGMKKIHYREVVQIGAKYKIWEDDSITMINEESQEK